jgi:reverse gyrase
MKLLIVESNGKIPKIKLGLLDNGFNDIHVVATNGRLFDIPSGHMNINRETFEIEAREPVNQHVIDFLLKKISQSDEIYIGTDNDSEGHVIARDIYDLVDDKSKAKRVIINNITSNDIASAIEGACDIGHSRHLPGMAKRIYDRMIGYEFSEFDWKNGSVQGSVGRVITPALNIIDKSEFVTAEISKQFNADNGDQWMLVAKPTNRSSLNIEGLAYAIEGIGSFNTIKVSESNMGADSLTGPSAIVDIASALNRSTVEIVELMQSMYEKGSLSYIRTDSSHLSSNSISEFMSMIYDKGGVLINREELEAGLLVIENFEKEIYREGAHEGLVPLKLNCSTQTSFNDIGLEDQVLLLLSDRMLKLSGNIKQVLSIGVPADNAVKLILTDLERQYGVKISIERHLISEGGHTRETDFNFEQRGMDTSDGKFGKTKYKRLPLDLIVAKLMLQNHLGRPSTFAYHASKLARRFIDPSSYSLNHMGQSSLLRARSLIPNLIDLDKAISVEKELSENNNNGISTRINSVNEILNVSFTGKASATEGVSKEASPARESSGFNLTI